MTATIVKNSKIQTAIVGYGYWGPNLTRNVAASRDGALRVICEKDTRRASAAQSKFPEIEVVSDYDLLLLNPAIDAVIIATPVSSHFELGYQALRAGKHVLMEKPLCTTSEQACRLMEEANRRKLVLMVGHTYVYSPSVNLIRKMVGAGELGRLCYYDSIRANLGRFRSDVNVIWDLGAHDLAILDYVVPASPAAVSVTAVSHLAGRPESLAYMSLFYADNFVAHIQVNWLSPVKVRRTLIAGLDQMILFDDLDASEKLRVYHGGFSESLALDSVDALATGNRIGEMMTPQVDPDEPMALQVADFMTCIQSGAIPVSSAESGLRVVKLLEALSTASKLGGRILGVG